MKRPREATFLLTGVIALATAPMGLAAAIPSTTLYKVKVSGTQTVR